MSTATAQPLPDTRGRRGEAVLISDPGPAIASPTPARPAPAEVTISDPTDHCVVDTHAGSFGGSDLSPETTTDHPTPTLPSSSRAPSATTDHTGRDTHTRFVVVAPSPGPTAEVSTPRAAPSDRDYLSLRMLSAAYWDAMGHRIALENRLRSGAVAPDIAADLLASANHVERQCELYMRKAFRKAAPDIAAWVKETPGLGEALMARLLGTIGHPVIASPHHWEGEGAERTLIADDPYMRNVAKLWAYCGHGDPARRKAKGMTAEDAFGLGSPRAKSLTYLVAVGCMKAVGGTVNYTSGKTVERARSPYRDIYELRRVATIDRPWTDGHKHADALRITGKTILRDLWIVAGGPDLIASRPTTVTSEPEIAALVGGRS